MLFGDSGEFTVSNWIWGIWTGTWWSGPLLHMACTSPFKFNWFSVQWHQEFGVSTRISVLSRIWYLYKIHLQQCLQAVPTIRLLQHQCLQAVPMICLLQQQHPQAIPLHSATVPLPNSLMLWTNMWCTFTYLILWFHFTVFTSNNIISSLSTWSSYFSWPYNLTLYIKKLKRNWQFWI